MKLLRGDMWSAWERADLFCITTNSFIRSDGTLTMGRGIALQAKQRFPGIERALATHIQHLGAYGLLISERWPAAKLAAFQTKRHFADNSELKLIQLATDRLLIWALTHHDAEIHLPFPGIGNGRLSREAVLPIIGDLPDNVFVWTK